MWGSFFPLVHFVCGPCVLKFPSLISSSVWQAFIPYSEHIPRPSPGLAVNFLVHAQVCFSFLFLPLPGTPLSQLFALSSVNPNMECCPLSSIPSPENILPGVLLRGHSSALKILSCCSQLKISRSAPVHVLAAAVPGSVSLDDLLSKLPLLPGDQFPHFCPKDPPCIHRVPACHPTITFLNILCFLLHKLAVPAGLTEEPSPIPSTGQEN